MKKGRIYQAIDNGLRKATHFAYGAGVLLLTAATAIPGKASDATPKDYTPISHVRTVERENPSSLERTVGTVPSRDEPLVVDYIKRYEDRKQRSESELLNFGAQYEAILVSDLKRHEDEKLWAYNDSEGNRTVGVGFNLDRSNARKVFEAHEIDFDAVYSGRQALTPKQSESLLAGDIRTAKLGAIKYLGKEDFAELHPDAKIILTNMVFNMGADKINVYQDLRRALVREDYARAALDMLYHDADHPEQGLSKWRKQTKEHRAGELIKRMDALGGING